LENGQLRAPGQRRGAIFPLDGSRGEDAMVGGGTLLALPGNCCEEHKPAENHQRDSKLTFFSHFRFLSDRYAVSRCYAQPPCRSRRAFSESRTGPQKQPSSQKTRLPSRGIVVSAGVSVNERRHLADSSRVFSAFAE